MRLTMKRIAIPAVLLALLLLGLFALSLFRIGWVTPSGKIGLELSNGRVLVLITEQPDLTSQFPPGFELDIDQLHPPSAVWTEWRYTGLSWRSAWGGRGTRMSNVFISDTQMRADYVWTLRSYGVPLIYPAGLALIATASPIAAVIRSRRRARSGRCLGCGYDLADMPDSTCPECGLATP